MLSSTENVPISLKSYMSSLVSQKGLTTLLSAESLQFLYLVKSIFMLYSDPNGTFLSLPYQILMHEEPPKLLLLFCDAVNQKYDEKQHKVRCQDATSFAAKPSYDFNSCLKVAVIN